MRYIYKIERDDEKHVLAIREFVRRSDDEMDLLGAQEHPEALMEKAAQSGRSAVVLSFRTEKFFPPAKTALAIADSVVALYGEKRGETTEAEVEEVTAPPVEPKRYEAQPRPEAEAEADTESEAEAPYIEDEFEDESLLEADDLDDEPMNLKVQDEDMADDFVDDL